MGQLQKLSSDMTLEWWHERAIRIEYEVAHRYQNERDCLVYQLHLVHLAEAISSM